MQDSLEDYIRISRNTKTEPSAQAREAQVNAHIKNECDKRALKIVEMSIDGKLRPEVFTKCLPFINQSHYQDIVEERAITKLCGYSVCGKKILDMPKKQYFISTKSNKVYDITERKNYCSNFCYKASLHLKNQIDNSPMWLRKLEDIPEYTLLHISEGGLPGEYIEQGIVKAQVEQSFTSISAFTHISLDDMVEREINARRGEVKSKQKTSHYMKTSSKLKNTMQTIKENVDDVEELICEENMLSSERKTTVLVKKDVPVHKKPNKIITLPSIDENEENKPENITLEESQSYKSTIHEQKIIMKKPKKKSAKSISQKLDIETIIHRVFNEWLTIETYIFIHGEEKIKNILDEKKLGNYFEALKVAELQRQQQSKYMEICKRLQLQELADDKFDEALVGNSQLKPPPDYKKLKEENKEINVKVKSFFSGTVYETPDPNFPSKSNNKQSVNDRSSNNAETDGPPAVLPLADGNSQNGLRRKIFLNSLNKTLHQLLQSLGISRFSAVLSDIQALVKTFRLKSDNITFKPIVWNYIAIVLLYILSLRDTSIREVLEDKRSQEFLAILLNSLPNKNNFISVLLEKVENIEQFVEHYITSSDNV